LDLGRRGRRRLREAIQAMLGRSPGLGAEEYAIHDHENFGGVSVEESMGLDAVVELARFLRERGTLGALVLEHLDGDIDAAVAALNEQYRGRFASLAECFQELTEETTTISKNLRLYIDYEARARDAQLGGEVFIIETAYDEVHVFWAR
jgi:antirestriction protein